MLDYRMETFLTLCQTLNYRATAQMLHITQPAVTQQIHCLEDYYGCRLFSYDKRHLSMTPEAELIRRHLNSMNYQEKHLLRTLKTPKGHELKIGVTKTIGEYVITAQVEGFLKEENNRISVETDNTKRILEYLDHGEIDFALVEGFFSHSKYQCRQYLREPFVGFCSLGHPFAGEISPMERLFQENIIVREKGSGTRSILKRMLEENNHTLSDFSRVTHIGNFRLLQHLVASGCGITFAYQAFENSHFPISPFQVDGWNISRDFYYVYLPNTSALQSVELFEAYRV